MKPKNSEPQRDKLRQEIVHLAAGELGPLSAWRLRRRIARDPELALEWEEVRTLWNDMKLLQTATARVVRPVHPALLTSSEAALTLGGGAKIRRIVLTACVATLIAVTGTVAAARHFLYSFSDIVDKEGPVGHGKDGFLGQEQPYDNVGRPSDPFPGMDRPGRTQHERDLGIEEELQHNGCGSTDGHGIAIGYCGDHKAITWLLVGDAEARFRRADNGRIVWLGRAYIVSDNQWTDNLRHKRPPESYADIAADEVPEIPVFEWRVGNQSHRVTGYGATAALTLPDGMRLTVEIVTRPSHPSGTAPLTPAAPAR